ncbi:TPA: hypothetical protein ACG6D5_003265, partial [Escherichia coli]
SPQGQAPRPQAVFTPKMTHSLREHRPLRSRQSTFAGHRYSLEIPSTLQNTDALQNRRVYARKKGFKGIVLGSLCEIGSFFECSKLVAPCSILIANKVNDAMIDAKKMNKDLKENISADLFNSHFTKFIKAEGIYLYCSLFFDIACIIVIGWLLYPEFVGK